MNQPMALQLGATDAPLPTGAVQGIFTPLPAQTLAKQVEQQRQNLLEAKGTLGLQQDLLAKQLAEQTKQTQLAQEALAAEQLRAQQAADAAKRAATLKQAEFEQAMRPTTSTVPPPTRAPPKNNNRLLVALGLATLLAALIVLAIIFWQDIKRWLGIGCPRVVDSSLLATSSCTSAFQIKCDCCPEPINICCTNPFVQAQLAFWSNDSQANRLLLDGICRRLYGNSTSQYRPAGAALEQNSNPPCALPSPAPAPTPTPVATPASAMPISLRSVPEPFSQASNWASFQ